METQNQSDLCFPELANISCRQSPGLVVFYLAPLVSISILTVVLNLLVITTISHFRQLHTPTNLLLLSLAVTDYLVGLQLIPMAIHRATSCWSLGDSLCSAFLYYVLAVTSSSVGNIVMISVDRYVAICDPLHYDIRVTVKRVQLCVCLCWFSSLSYSGVVYYNQEMQPGKYHSCDGRCVIVYDFAMGVADLVVSFFLPLCSVVMLYTKVFVVAVSQARAMRAHAPGGTLKHRPLLRAKKSELKAARSLGVLVVVFLLCFCPYYGVFLARDSLRNHTLQVCVIYLYYFNSCTNPLIYAFFYPWFRRAVKHIVTLRILRPGSRELSVL